MFFDALDVFAEIGARLVQVNSRFVNFRIDDLELVDETARRRDRFEQRVKLSGVGSLAPEPIRLPTSAPTSPNMPRFD
jgi:hypothetical protein